MITKCTTCGKELEKPRSNRGNGKTHPCMACARKQGLERSKRNAARKKK